MDGIDALCTLSQVQRRDSREEKGEQVVPRRPPPLSAADAALHALSLSPMLFGDTYMTSASGGWSGCLQKQAKKDSFAQ